MDVATQVLRHEHEALAKMLDFTKIVAGQIRRGEGVQSEGLGSNRVFRVFMDDCLLTKEENVLFPALEERASHGKAVQSV